MTQSIILQHVKQYSDASEQLNHDLAADELEDWLDFSLGILSAIKRIETRYKAQLESCQKPFDRGTIELIDALYAQWHAPVLRLHSLIQASEAAGIPIANAQVFIAAGEDSHIPGFDASCLKQADAEYRKAGGQPLDTAMKALRMPHP